MVTKGWGTSSSSCREGQDDPEKKSKHPENTNPMKIPVQRVLEKRKEEANPPCQTRGEERSQHPQKHLLGILEVLQYPKSWSHLAVRHTLN